MRYKFETGLGIYHELKQVIKGTDNDFTEYISTEKCSKDEIIDYIKGFYEYVETNKLYIKIRINRKD